MYDIKYGSASGKNNIYIYIYNNNKINASSIGNLNRTAGPCQQVEFQNEKSSRFGCHTKNCSFLIPLELTISNPINLHQVACHFKLLNTNQTCETFSDELQLPTAAYCFFFFSIEGIIMCVPLWDVCSDDITFDVNDMVLLAKKHLISTVRNGGAKKSDIVSCLNL